MSNFIVVGHVDTFAVVAALYKRQGLFDDPHELGRAFLHLRQPVTFAGELPREDEPCRDTAAIEGWPSIRKLTGQVRQMAGLMGQKIGFICIERLDPGGIVPWHAHTDPYMAAHARFVVPLITNPGVRNMNGTEQVHMPVGSVWLSNMQVHQTEVNFGQSPRYHLSIDIRRPVDKNET